MVLSLVGKKLLVTGGSRGLGAAICTRFAQEGCDVAINYVSNAERAKEVAHDVEGAGRKSFIIQGDVGKLADCQNMVREAARELGGLDVIIANAGWTKPSAFGDLNALSEEEWDRCWAVNTKSTMHLVREALPIFNKNAEGGCFLVTSSVAGLVAGGSTMAYSVTKSAGLHLVLCLAETQGPKLRINAICPGWLPTEWGISLGEETIARAKAMSKLGQETKIDDCVEAFVMAAKNTSMTGAKIRVGELFQVTLLVDN